MYAWAKDAPPTALPPDVGFQLDEEEDGYIVMQVRTRDLGGFDHCKPRNRPTVDYEDQFDRLNRLRITLIF